MSTLPSAPPSSKCPGEAGAVLALQVVAEMLFAVEVAADAFFEHVYNLPITSNVFRRLETDDVGDEVRVARRIAATIAPFLNAKVPEGVLDQSLSPCDRLRALAEIIDRVGNSTDTYDEPLPTAVAGGSQP